MAMRCIIARGFVSGGKRDWLTGVQVGHLDQLSTSPSFLFMVDSSR